jgi:hypothetical protein
LPNALVWSQTQGVWSQNEFVLLPNEGVWLRCEPILRHAQDSPVQKPDTAPPAPRAHSMIDKKWAGPLDKSMQREPITKTNRARSLPYLYCLEPRKHLL